MVLARLTDPLSSYVVPREDPKRLVEVQKRDGRAPSFRLHHPRKWVPLTLCDV